MRSLAFVTAALAFAACAPAEAPGDPSASHGPGVAITAAALNLEGVGDVVWDLEVVNGDAATVWQRRITSSSYGDSAGSASYVGPCDADPTASSNTVRVWVVGVYAEDVSAADAGAFASGDGTLVVGTALPFQNPTSPGAAGALRRTFPCVQGEDTPVHFDVTLMRPAQQGFFDIAVNFNNIFCSAKFDCCEDSDGDGCEDGEDLALLFTAGAGRGRTMVLGFACTAGIDTDVDTVLYMDDLAFDCSPAVEGFQTAFSISTAAAAPGNLCDAGDLASCLAVTDPDPAEVDTYLFQAAVYRGDELLSDGAGSVHKVYWNVALGVNADISACTLKTKATADDADNLEDGLVGGVVADGAVYPFVHWEVPLGACASEALSFDGTGPVQTRYTATNPAEPTTFDFAFAPGLPPTPVCASPCEHGGTCVGPDACACAAGWGGPTCATLLVGTSCKALRQVGATASGLYTLDPDGTAGPLAPFTAYCDMETDGGGFTMCWTEDGEVHMSSQYTYGASAPFGTDGYRSDCRNIPFDTVLYVRESDQAKAWFTRDSGGTLVASATNWFVSGSANGLWTGHGVANTDYSYQLNICDAGWMYTGFMITGYTDCFKACNNWCNDRTSPYFRPDGSDTAWYNGSAFNENGHNDANYLAPKLLSLGVR